MDPRPRPRDQLYLQIRRRMTPERRLAKAFELGEMGRELLRTGLQLRHPGSTEEGPV
jgi:hypothetical protein